MKGLRLYAVIAMICITQNSFADAAQKKLTTYQRQVNLMKRINEAQKSKELTERQARGLRKDLSKVAERKQKDRDKNVVKKEPIDMSDVEERLTKISEKIDELKQENIKDAQK
jgi:hypothetical protein